MFTGIVASVGCIVESRSLAAGVRLTLDAATLGLDDVAPGDSIAVNGVCLTAIAIRGQRFDADVSQETLRCTVGLNKAHEVNLEKAMRLSDRVGGHLVTGHVDGVGEVVACAPAGESQRLVIRAPRLFARYIARKGSITVNEVDGCEFEVNLIPHTLQVTTLKHLAPGGKVNLEVDMIARYVERIFEMSGDRNKT